MSWRCKGRAALFGAVRGSAVAPNALLALLSVAIGLAACEAMLRLFHPRYELAASPPTRTPTFALNLKRTGEVDRYEVTDTWATYVRRRQPDTRVKHLVVHNNLGGRQSRDFPADSLDETVNIAFFGDSQTENLRMPAPYSYTEPLDYLLNAHPAAAGTATTADTPLANLPNAFNVLNFGVGRYGTGRSWLRWRHLPVRRKLAHVFYMVWENDLADLATEVRRGMVRVGQSGEVLEGSVPRPPLWKRLLSRSHLTYLAFDAWHRFAAWRRPVDAFGTVAETTPDGRENKVTTVRVLRELLHTWKREVEADGGAFHVVLLPSPIPMRWIANDEELRDELESLDLRDCFAAADPPFDYSKWRFASNGHWNPKANMVAASCLYRYLEGVLDLPARPNEDLAHARRAYYRAFLAFPDWEGERYNPDDLGMVVPTAVRDDPSLGGIVAKYLALEFTMANRWLRAVSAAREAGALATSVWDIYATPSQTLLVYVKRPCPAGFRPPGQPFLHVVPFTPKKPHAAADFVNLDHGPYSPLHRHEGECVFSARLPNYPLSSVRTGRYTVADEGADATLRELWSARFQMRLAHSVWDVHASASGRGLDFVKKPCDETDTQARFFLHAHPAAVGGGRPARYANLDFDWTGKGVMADGACRISVMLPDFPIAFVRTGQFRSGVVSRQLWSAHIDFAEVERAGARPSGDGA